MNKQDKKEVSEAGPELAKSGPEACKKLSKIAL